MTRDEIVKIMAMASAGHGSDCGYDDMPGEAQGVYWCEAFAALAALEAAGLRLVPLAVIQRLDAEAVLISPHDEAVKREVLDELRACAPAIASQEDGK